MDFQFFKNVFNHTYHIFFFNHSDGVCILNQTVLSVSLCHTSINEYLEVFSIQN